MNKEMKRLQDEALKEITGGRLSNNFAGPRVTPNSDSSDDFDSVGDSVEDDD